MSLPFFGLSRSYVIVDFAVFGAEPAFSRSPPD
jgi:hypothetical protein